MAYQYPTSGGLKLSYNGKTVGVFFIDAGNNMMALAVAEAVGSNQWEPRWSTPWDMEQSIKANIQAAGGEVNWIKQFLAQINDALVRLFAPSPTGPTGPVTVRGAVNDALEKSFTLTIGPNGAPVLASK